MKRPFRGLRDAGPDAAYDAVIVGAGIGGLFCANQLAQDGLKVLLVEQHYMVGGYCSTFRRKGFTFDASTHFYPLLGNPETITGKILGDLGIETGWVKMDPVDTFHFPDGSRFDVPADFDSYRARLAAEFPHQRAELDAFFAAARETYLKGLLCYFRNRPGEYLGDYRPWTVRQALDHFIGDRKLKLLLTADCPHWGSPPKRTSFVFDSMLRLSYFLGNYYPVGGSQAFADELGRRFEELGGHILINTRAHRIIVDRGRVCGVMLETLRGPLRGHHRVAADTVVSNADLRLTVDELLAGVELDPEYRRQIDELRPSYPCFLSHIGLRGIDPEVLDRAQGYYWNSWDPDVVGRHGLRCKVFAPTLYEPDMAPPGGQIVILQKVLDVPFDDIASWPDHKAAIERYVSAHLEKVIPGIGEKIVVQTSASAMTAKRFTLNAAGAMLGWEMSPDQLGERRPAVDAPVDGLWLVGHWTRPGGGITPVIVSAVEVAKRIAGSSPVKIEAQALARGVAGAELERLERVGPGVR